MIKYMNLIGIKARKASEYKIKTKVKNKIIAKVIFFIIFLFRLCYVPYFHKNLL